MTSENNEDDNVSADNRVDNDHKMNKSNETAQEHATQKNDDGDNVTDTTHVEETAENVQQEAVEVEQSNLNESQGTDDYTIAKQDPKESPTNAQKEKEQPRTATSAPALAVHNEQDNENDIEQEKESKNAKTEETNTDGDKSNRPAALPPRPIKRARTAYFIFAEEMRPKLQAEHPGEGVTVMAKLLGQKWAQISSEEKEGYQQKAAEERQKVATQLEEYRNAVLAAGGNLDDDMLDEKNNADNNNKKKDPLELVFPVARIRKIAKLDPEVKNMSKEALHLVVKCAELATTKLGKEATKVARMQNRRTILPQDVAHVCSHREPFLFLKEDIKDLTEATNMKKRDKNGETTGPDGHAAVSKKDALREAAAAGSKPLTSYFAANTTTNGN